MSWRAVAVAVALACALEALSAPSIAQSASASQRSIEKANAALVLYEEGKWDEALGLFREADALYHSPVYTLYAARSLKGAGRWLEARREYEQVSGESLPDGGPEAWSKAQAEARTELAELGRDMPSVIVEVAGGSHSTSVSMDDAPVSVGRPIDLAPGKHRFEASDGGRKQTRTVSVERGAKSVRVVLELPAAPARKPHPTRRVERPSSANVPGLVLTGVGSAAVLAGGIFGVVALKKASNTKHGLPSTCNGNTCPESQRAEIEADVGSARTFGNISTGLLIGGGLTLATGLVLLFTDPGGRPTASTRAGTALVCF